jgi:hypothetical protein
VKQRSQIADSNHVATGMLSETIGVKGTSVSYRHKYKYGSRTLQVSDDGPLMGPTHRISVLQPSKLCSFIIYITDKVQKNNFTYE